MKNKHLIVVSVDALVYEDLEYAKTLPNFGRLIEKGAIIERVKTIYPSLTHPVHASIISGAPAGVTKIVNNATLSPGKDGAWYNMLDEIDCDTILHAAKRAGLTTAVCEWPVTAKGQNVIDYLVPDILNEYSTGREDEILDVFREYGTTECLMDIVEEGISRFGFRDEHPAVDHFQIFCASEIIKRHKPDLLLTHPSLVDNARHLSGIFGERVKPALEQTDVWLGQLLDAVREAGIEENTDFIILSDHGQLNIVRVVCPNVYLADAGYIKADKDGKLLSCDAYIQSCGLSAHVYLSNPNDVKLYNEIHKLLNRLAQEGIYGFERVFTKDEANALYGLSGDFSFVLESDGYSSFGEAIRRPIVRPLDSADYRTGKGTHGHMPEKGPQPTFIGYGPSFKGSTVVKEGNILNHAPTIAAILGLELRDAKGKIVDETLNI
jgi:predicted AlkP superfamily pyrophosphatase or phosphodiesterase